MQRWGRALLLCLAMVDLAMSDQTLYRTTDAQGHVSFSDDPWRGGEPVELAPISVVPALPPAQDLVSPAPHYAAFNIVAPTADTNLPTGRAGNLRVQLAIEPALRPGHQLRLRLDGDVVGPASRDSAIALTNLTRGQHHLRAELIDTQGQVLRRTPMVTLHVQRASVNLSR